MNTEQAAPWQPNKPLCERFYERVEAVTDLLVTVAPLIADSQAIVGVSEAAAPKVYQF